MKKVQFKLILRLFAVVMLASVLAVIITGLIGFLFVGSHEWQQQTVFIGMALRELLTVILIVAFTALIITLNAKRMVAPIVKLSEETKRIAKGNFETEIEISARPDEIAELERNFAVMVKELKSIEYMRKDFVANISHDLKTPLSIIKGYADVLEEDGLPEEERKQYAATIKSEADRLIGMTSNILRMSKLSSQNIQTARGTFSLDEQIRQAAVLLQPKWSQKNIQFDLHLIGIKYTGDEELLSQVWFNLLDNAIKFSHEGGVIKIGMGESKKSVQVKVSDGGIGIDPQAADRIFDQFYQAESSRGNGGSGLGLSIAKRIVQLHGGTIEVSSPPGEGASFLVTLPFGDATGT